MERAANTIRGMVDERLALDPPAPLQYGRTPPTKQFRSALYIDARVFAQNLCLIEMELYASIQPNEVRAAVVCRACVRVCVRVCAYVCVRACVCVCVCVCVSCVCLESTFGSCALFNSPNPVVLFLWRTVSQPQECSDAQVHLRAL